MNRILLMTLLSSIIFLQCGKENENDAVPACVRAKISEIKAQTKWNPPAEVAEYLYNGKRVFLFTSDCCDQYIQLYDENCNYICAPSGGFTGHGDGKCADFYSSATFIKLVWKDNR